jgi:hypothetical protein
MGSQKSTTKQNTEPWAPTQDALKNLIPQVESNYTARTNQEFFPGQTYAGFDPAQTEALSGTEGLARRQIGGDSNVHRASDYTQRVLGGEYTAAGNPHWAAVADSVGDPVQAALSAQFSKAGRGTSGDAARYVSHGMTAALAPIQFQAYEAERQRQEAAAGRAPQLDQAMYDPHAALYGVGGTRQAMEQQAIQEAMARDDFLKNRNANALSESSGLLMGLGKMGGESTTTQTTRPSALQTIAGVGMTAAGMMSGMGNPFSSMSFLPWMQKPSMGGMGA